MESSAVVNLHKTNDFSGTMATAVEEQNATTNEISSNVRDAARSSGEITSNVSGVAEAAESTSRGAGDAQKAAQELVLISVQLHSLVERFKIDASENSGENNTAPKNTHAMSVGSGS